MRWHAHRKPCLSAHRSSQDLTDAPRKADRGGTLNQSRLEDLIARIRAINFGLGAEQATREMAVNPVIDALGWDTFNPDEVDREYSVRGGRVDYCLRTPSRNLVLIEVKRAGTDLDDHEEQLLRYAFDEGVPLAALTNGLIWWLYLPRAEGRWQQRQFCRIDLHEQDPANTAAALHRFLNHDGVLNGKALQEAQREFDSQERDRRLRSALHEAWNRVLRDPNSLLRDLLSETVHEIAGGVPDDEMVDEFLAAISGSGNGAPEPVPPIQGGKLPPARRERTDFGRASPPASKRRSGSRPTAFLLDGQRHEVGNWRHLLVQLCEQLATEHGPGFVDRVSRLRGRKRPYYSSATEDLREAIPIPGLALHVEGNVSASQAERIARMTLGEIRGSDDGFEIEIGGRKDAVNAAGPRKRVQAPGPSSPKLETFTFRKPVAFVLDGRRHEVTRWREIIHGVCEILATNPDIDFQQRVTDVRGKGRVYFSKDPAVLHQPLRLAEIGLFVEGKFSANDCVRLARRVLIAVRGSDEGFEIEVKNPRASP